MIIYLSAIDTEERRSKFEQIYDNYRFTMLYVAKGIVKEHSSAEDVVHDTFLKLIEIIDDIEDVNSSKSKGLILTIVKHKAIDYLRKIKPDRNILIDEVEFPLPDDQPIPLERIINAEGYNRLLDLIDELDEKYSAVIELKYIHGYSGREIANILDITEENANMRIFRARKMLIKKIEGDDQHDKY